MNCRVCSLFLLLHPTNTRSGRSSSGELGAALQNSTLSTSQFVRPIEVISTSPARHDRV